MAKIRNFEETQKALEAIQSNIQQLKNLKDFMSTENPTCRYELAFKCPAPDAAQGDGKPVKPKKVSVKFKLSDRDNLRLVLAEHEEALCNEIRSLASQYQIDLEPEEEALLQ